MFISDEGASAIAVECLEQAIELHINNGRFTQAAKFHKEAGELFETDLNYPQVCMLVYLRLSACASGMRGSSTIRSLTP